MTYWIICLGCVLSAAVNWVQIIRAQKIYRRIEELEGAMIRIEMLCEHACSENALIDPGEVLMTIWQDVRRINPLAEPAVWGKNK